MDGVHDMGGMHGFGPVRVERDEPVFHATWEGRVLGMQVRTRRLFHLDEFRHAIERIPAARYLNSSYYERWLTALETLAVEKGLVTREELTIGRAGGPAPAAPVRPADDPTPLRARFRPGDRVVTRRMHPAGHTRFPRYVRGRRGVVRSVNGPFLLPDANVQGTRRWEAVYAVEFAARELWGDDAPAADSVCVDLWESYLIAEADS